MSARHLLISFRSARGDEREKKRTKELTPFWCHRHRHRYRFRHCLRFSFCFCFWLCCCRCCCRAIVLSVDTKQWKTLQHFPFFTHTYTLGERLRNAGKGSEQPLHSFYGFFIYYSQADRATQRQTHTHTHTHRNNLRRRTLNDMKCCGFCGMFYIYIFLEIVFRFRLSPASLYYNNGGAWQSHCKSRRVECRVSTFCSMTDNTHTHTTSCKNFATPRSRCLASINQPPQSMQQFF